MPNWLKNPFKCCIKEPEVEGRRYTAEEKGKGKAEDYSSGDEHDVFMWARALDAHSYGEFSIAAVQANENMEDRSQVEAGQNATAVGIYDGHGGTEASQYLCDNLFNNILRLAQEKRSITEGVLTNAIAAIEEGFIGEVAGKMKNQPTLKTTGSCCLVGVLWHRRLFIANLGDSRAVLGYFDPGNIIRAEQLTDHHNASMEPIREELTKAHPEIPDVVVLKDGAWRIKGLIQVSRTIGDLYLKSRQFAVDPSVTKFHLKIPIKRAVLSSDPQVIKRELLPYDRFVIFASDGLWDELDNIQAVEIVHKNPRRGIAKRLLKEALTVAAGKVNKEYADLKAYEKGYRRRIHDDTSVVVLFLDYPLYSKQSTGNGLSVRAFSDSVGPSKFIIDDVVHLQ